MSGRRLFLELTSDTIILPWTKCIYIIAVFCAIKQMVLTPFPGWSSRDPDTLSTWFPNMECFKGPPYPPSPRGGLDVCARIHTLPASLPPPLLLIHLIQFLGFLHSLLSLPSPTCASSSGEVQAGVGGWGWGKKGDSIISSSRLWFEHFSLHLVNFNQISNDMMWVVIFFIESRATLSLAFAGWERIWSLGLEQFNEIQYRLLNFRLCPKYKEV